MLIHFQRLLVVLALFVSPLIARADTCDARSFKQGLVLQNGWDIDFYSYMHLVRAGDFNGDGHSDVVASNENGVFLLLNAGVTPPQFNQDVKVATGNVQGMAVGDMNGDGKLDIVFSDYDDGRVKTLLGNGDGTFTEHSFAIYEPMRLALSDMNGDGKLDIVVMSSFDAPRLSVFLGNGDGTYAYAYFTPIGGYVKSIAIADLDGDGHPDVITAIFAPSQLEIRRGVGDGTLGGPVITAEPAYIYSIVAADLDGDGHIDLAFADTGTKNVSILRNDGSGGFAPPATLGPPSVDPNNSSLLPSTPTFILAGDFLGTGRMDLALFDGFGLLNIYPSNGDGTYGTPAAFRTTTSPTDVAIIDYDGDGRLDLAIANGFLDFNTEAGNVVLMANSCSSTTTTVVANPTLGTSNAPVTVQLTGHEPTGTVALREGSSVLATNPASTTVAFTVSLPAGDHSLVADYSGDFWNQPSTSDPVVVHVTNETTSISLAFPSNPTTFDVGASATATVTSSTGDTPTGTYTVTLDGLTVDFPYTHPIGGSVSLGRPAVGTHTVLAQYSGDATHPPSTSTPITLVVNKSTPHLTIYLSGGPVTGIAILGSPESVIMIWGSSNPTGSITLHDGSTILGAFQCCSTQVTLPAGLHTITATYPGDANYASATAVTELSVVDGSATNAITAFYDGQQVLIYYNTVAGANHYRINRLGPNGLVQFTNGSGYYGDTTVVPNAAYTYAVQAFDSSSNLLATTFSDVVSTATFSDEALVPGTPVRAVHLTELKTATDRLRALAGLAPMTFKDGTPAPGAFIHASQINDLRNAIAAARTALGVPAFVWSNASLTPRTTPIRVSDVQELRNALR